MPSLANLLSSSTLKMLDLLRSLTLYDVVVKAMNDDTTFDRLKDTLADGRRTSLTVV
jgi:hypothetical protein